jgi:GMP synthase (glutamine-hydrolysing)
MHVPFEGPGSIEDWFRFRGTRLHYWKLYEKIDFPRTDDVDFLLIMGGPMNIYDYDTYPYLAPEKKFIENCIRKKKKVLGICLGAQLIADVLGQKVYPNTDKEIGWFPVRGTGDMIPESLVPFHWHEETFDLPEGAVHQASSEICRNQAFTFGSNVLALQFHLEVTPSLVEGMLKYAGSGMGKGSWVQSKKKIRQGLVNEIHNRKILHSLLDNFTG